MIKSQIRGDIIVRRTADVFDIIIGMNTTLGGLNGIGLPEKWLKNHGNPFDLGAVESFKIDSHRRLHMIFCHTFEAGGWKDADRYVLEGMNYLFQRYGNDRYFSIVEIGTGKVGSRDGADATKIRAAMEESLLNVDLFIFNSPTPLNIETLTTGQLTAYESWSPLSGLKK